MNKFITSSLVALAVATGAAHATDHSQRDLNDALANFESLRTLLGSPGDTDGAFAEFQRIRDERTDFRHTSEQLTAENAELRAQLATAQADVTAAVAAEMARVADEAAAAKAGKIADLNAKVKDQLMSGLELTTSFAVKPGMSVGVNLDVDAGVIEVAPKNEVSFNTPTHKLSASVESRLGYVFKSGQRGYTHGATGELTAYNMGTENAVSLGYDSGERYNITADESADIKVKGRTDDSLYARFNHNSGIFGQLDHDGIFKFGVEKDGVKITADQEGKVSFGLSKAF